MGNKACTLGSFQRPYFCSERAPEAWRKHEHKRGRTPIHMAALGGHVSVVDELLEKANVDMEPVDDERKTPLHLAAESNHLEVAERLLSAGADPDPVAIRRYRPLHYAARSGNKKLVQKLLESGAIVDPALEETKTTPLHLACYYGNTDCVKTLLEYGADTEKHGTIGSLWGCTPLHFSMNDEMLLKMLLEHGAEIDSRSGDGSTTLMYSAYRHLACVRILLEKNANIGSTNNQGKAALHYAVTGCNEALIRHLLMKGADPKSRTTSGVSMQVLLEEDVEVEAIDEDGMTPLHYATQHDNTTTARLLLERGANIEAKDRLGFTPLNIAAQKDSLTTAGLLLERGADLESLDFYYSTPLHNAAYFNATATARMLLERGANIETKTSDGNTPLTILAQNGDLETLQLIQDTRAADFNSQDGTCWAVLQWAVFYGREDIVRFLLERRINTAIEPHPLQLAASRDGFENIIELLLVNSDANSGDSYRGSVLQVAAQHGHTKTVERLLNAGADKYVEDEHGWTPSLCASKVVNRQSLQRLLPGRDGVVAKPTLPPTSWSIIHKSPILRLENENMDVIYEKSDTGLEKNHRPALIRADHPVPAEAHAYYFEITVIDPGDTG